MDFEKIKKYPSQISTAFKRFPLASTLAFFTFIAFIINTEIAPDLDDIAYHPFVWLAIYPIAAMLIALTASLIQESRKSTNSNIQAIASGAWIIASLLLVFYFFDKDESRIIYFASTISLVYITATLSLFIAPFWKQPNENGFWIFLQKNIKALISAALVSAILLGATEALVFGFQGLFDIDIEEKIYLYILYFCTSTIFPILYFSNIPSIDDCLEEQPALSKFATSSIRFLFIPVLSLSILLFYAYIIKFIALWDMPRGMVSYFVSGFMIFMLALIIVMYPARLAPTATFEKKLLKIFPAACVPLVALMSVGLIRRIFDYGFSTERIYATIINIYFYAIIAILFIDKIKLKSRYIAIIFCVLYFIFTDSPLKASNINQYIWKSSIKSALIDQGYNEFPLSDKDANEFITKLQKSEDKKAKIVLSRIKISDNKDLIPYFSEKCHYSTVTDNCCNTDNNKTDSTKKFDSFNATISHSKHTRFAIPKGSKEAVRLDQYFDKDDFEYLGDTLSFRISIKPDDESNIDSISTDTASVQTQNKVYNFKVLKQTLKQDSTKILTTKGATIGLQYIHTSQWSEKGRSLKIEGLLFIE